MALSRFGRKPHRGPIALRHLVLEKLKAGPMTTEDLLTEFQGYAVGMVARVIHDIRAMGYNIRSCPYKRNERSMTLSYRYTLMPAVKIVIQ